MTALRVALVVALLAAWMAPAVAQAPAKQARAAPSATGFPNAVQGFSRNRNQPVKIEATALEVRDRDQTAVFTGNVVVQQGDTELRCRELTVHYEGGALATATAADKQPVSPQRIRRLVASGGVIITSRDQRATGASGVYDLRANTVTLSGDVVLTQGPNVMRGERLVVDLTSGLSRLDAEGKARPGRVHGLFVPGSVRERPEPPTPDAPGRPPAAVPLPRQ
jgi:lipopolysaccharide export system protein LptA